jgi:hypothetical protein
VRSDGQKTLAVAREVLAIEMNRRQLLQGRACWGGLLTEAERWLQQQQSPTGDHSNSR